MSGLTDAELAAHLADVAGKLLLQVRACGLMSLKALGKAGDQTANQYLIHAIAEQRPDDGLLSEESKDTDARLSKSRVWIIDPASFSWSLPRSLGGLSIRIVFFGVRIEKVANHKQFGCGLGLRWERGQWRQSTSSKFTTST
jgi:hypothetical protein